MFGRNDARRGNRRFGGRASCALAVLAGLTLGACGSSGPAYEEPTEHMAAIVEMSDERLFEPAEITIQVGDRIEWRNTSDEVHTVTADPRVAADPARIQVPEGAEPFNSAAISPGRVFRQTFTVPGTYRYVCLPHQGEDMAGIVIVEPRS